MGKPLKFSLLKLTDPSQVTILSKCISKFGLELAVVRRDELLLTIISDEEITAEIGSGIFSNWDHLFAIQWPEEVKKEVEEKEPIKFTVVAKEPETKG